MRLPNIKMLLRWPSRMHICCLVEIALYMVPQAKLSYGCPNLGPPLPRLLSMVQSVVLNFSSKVYSKRLLKGSPLSCTSLE